MREVRAKERGFDNIKIREIGDCFAHEGPLYSWMELVGEEPAVKSESPQEEKRSPEHPEPAKDEKSSLVTQVLGHVFGSEQGQEHPKAQDEPALAEPPRKKAKKPKVN